MRRPRELPPPARDRLAGRYYTRCSCSSTRELGPCCYGGPTSRKQRRQVEKRQLRAWIARGEYIEY